MSESQVTKDWIIIFPAFKIVPLKVAPLETVCKEAENAIEVLLAKSHKAYHIHILTISHLPINGPAFTLDTHRWQASKEGSVSHLITISDEMVGLAYNIWMDIFMNRKKINQIHIIAPQNGAIFAIKFLAFFAQYANHLGNYTMLRTYHLRCSISEDLTDGFLVHSIFRSLTLIYPSLPKPTFMARILCLPSIYCFIEKPVPRPGMEMICVFTRDDLDMAYKIINVNVDHIFELPHYKIEQVLTAQWLKLLSPDLDELSRDGIAEMPSVTIAGESSKHSNIDTMFESQKITYYPLN